MLLIAPTRADDTQRAISEIQRAVYRTQFVQETKDKLEKTVKRNVNETVLVTTGAVISIVNNRAIDLDDLGNLRFKLGDLEVRPNLRYEFSGDASGGFQAQMSF